MAAAKKLDRGYLGRILMLALVAPDIVEAIINGRQPAALGVHALREGFRWSGGSKEPHEPFDGAIDWYQSLAEVLTWSPSITLAI